MLGMQIRGPGPSISDLTCSWLPLFSGRQQHQLKWREWGRPPRCLAAFLLESRDGSLMAPEDTKATCLSPLGGVRGEQREAREG